MCPPRDQTERLPQKWRLLVPRLRQKMLVSEAEDRTTNDPKDMLFNMSEYLNLWSKLAKPGPPPDRRHDRIQRRQLLGKTKLSNLESLPGELLGIVLDDGGLTKQDLIAVGHASLVLRPHVLNHIERQARKANGPWAGSELAYIGTYLRTLPEPFAKDDLFKMSVTGKPSYFNRGMPRARSLHWAAISEYGTGAEEPEAAWTAALDDFQTLDPKRFADARGLEMKADILAIFADLWSTPPDSIWMLRNLTTKQYIRCRLTRPGESPCKGFVDHPNARSLPIRVDDVFLMYCCWTSLRPWDDPNGLCIYQGLWAGHCFDIVSQKGVDAARDGWSDVTGEVVTEASRLRGLTNMPEQRMHAHLAPRPTAGNMSSLIRQP